MTDEQSTEHGRGNLRGCELVTTVGKSQGRADTLRLLAAATVTEQEAWCPIS